MTTLQYLKKAVTNHMTDLVNETEIDAILDYVLRTSSREMHSFSRSQVWMQLHTYREAVTHTERQSHPLTYT